MGKNSFFLPGSDTTPRNQYSLNSPGPGRKVGSGLLLPRSFEKVKSGPYPTNSCYSPSQKFQSPQRRNHFCNPELFRNNVVPFLRVWPNTIIHSPWDTLLNSP